jgi:prepilin-type N-terminal cleavage/methylation domain-containing protein
MRSQRGMTLVEMLVAMTVPAAVVGGIQGLPRSQSDSFENAADLIAMAMADRPECPASGNSRDQQALVIHASAFRFSFEADCLEKGSTDQVTSYRSGGAETAYFPVSGQTIAPPPTETDTDTATFFFQADPVTPRTDDFVLMRQISGRQPEAMLRNVLAYPGRPFFQYYYRETGDASAQPVPASWLPLQHPTVKHGSAADTGTAARIDTLLAVDVNYSITNGRTGTAEQTQLVSKIIVFSTLSRKKSRLCDEEPFFSQASLIKPAYREMGVMPVALIADRRTCTSDW